MSAGGKNGADDIIYSPALWVTSILDLYWCLPEQPDPKWVCHKATFFPSQQKSVGAKKSFSSSPEIGSWVLHHAGRSQEPSLFVMNGTVCTAAARTSLVEEGWRGSLQNGSGGDAAKHLLRLGSHSLTLFKTRKKLLIVKSWSVLPYNSAMSCDMASVYWGLAYIFFSEKNSLIAPRTWGTVAPRDRSAVTVWRTQLRADSG